MRIWTVANQKGGVGKTTTTVTLGGLLAGWGLRTLLLDMDPHGSLTSYLRYDPDAVEESSFSLFKAALDKRLIDPQTLRYRTGTAGLELIPASVSLAILDKQSGSREGMGLVLRNALEQIVDDFDYVLIDCPPILGVLLINALAACEHLIIPVQTEFLALKGLERMLHTLKMVLKARSAPLPYTIVPTLYDSRTRASVDTLAVLQKRYPETLWPGYIPVDTNFREASRAGIPPSTYEPKTHGVLAYGQLLEHLRAEQKREQRIGMVG